MNRTAAVALLRERLDKDTTYRHCVSVEGVMRRLGEHFGEDVDQWGLVGLLHDIDFDFVEGDASRHGHVGADWLRAAGLEEQLVEAILGHVHEEYRTNRLAHAVTAADALAGFLVACALVRPDKTEGMKVSSCKKKLKEKAFAPGVDRTGIVACEENLGVPLEDFLRLGIEGLHAVAGEAGL
ncbi:MAG: HD domain-containing protein [Actinomycetota bacterium]|jgi:putative nucleotidyltransferase with HDIG domain